MFRRSFGTKNVPNFCQSSVSITSQRDVMRTKNVPGFCQSTLSNTSRRDVTVDATEAVDLYHATISTPEKPSSKLPVVVLHGLIGSMKALKRIAIAINKQTGRTVISPDARNHGHSPESPQHTYIHMAHDTAKLINKLGHPKVSIMGHSMGGRTAMALSLLYPDLISSIVIGDISPAKTSEVVTHRLSILLNTMIAISKSVRPSMSLEEARRTADEILKPVRPDARVRESILQAFVQTKTGDFKWRVNVPALQKNFLDITSFPEELKGLKYPGPALFIAGAKSDYIRTSSDFALIREYFPAAERVFVEGVGHALPYRHPETFAKIACDFIENNAE